MPINHEHQLNLLKDLLSNHRADCCGSVSECEQMDRLVEALKNNSNVHQAVLPVLDEVQTYSQTGIEASNLDTHIESHQGQLEQWVDTMNQHM